jgi:hypothetical protein
VNEANVAVIERTRMESSKKLWILASTISSASRRVSDSQESETRHLLSDIPIYILTNVRLFCYYPTSITIAVNGLSSMIIIVWQH